MTGRIFLKIIAAVFCLLLVSLITVDFLTGKVAQDAYIQNMVDQLAGKGRILALAQADPLSLDRGRARRFAEAAGGRVTVVRSDGKVMVDSEADASGMENHRTPSRPELLKAFDGKVGFITRHSATIGIDFLYVAVPVRGGAIRIAVPTSEIDSQVRGVRAKILTGAAIAFLPAILIAALVSRWISGRLARIMAHAEELARGNFRARLPAAGGAEFAELARKLNDTAVEMEKTVAQLQREQAELEHVERIRKDFVINVSHELRTPLASIQGYTETLIDGALHDPHNNMRFLAIIRHNAERLARITEDLLTLSRIEQHRQKFEFQPHSVRGLLKNALDIIRPIAEKRNLKLHLAGAEESQNFEAWCDSEAVSQILSNLLDNAIKYTPAGGRIEVGAKRAGEYVELYVRDTGIGIPAEDLPRLFERFYRVDKARSRELGGTGLGLSIVKHLAAAHGAVVRVESRPNEGSTFYFTLPLEESLLPEERLHLEFTAS